MTKCNDCLKVFNGGHDYSRHMAACNGNPRQCPHCGTWFMTRGQRDHHVTLRHGG